MQQHHQKVIQNDLYRWRDAAGHHGVTQRSGRAGNLIPELTDRENDVLKLAAFGFTNKEIARRIDVGVKSVETYKARGLSKLGLKTRADLVRFASNCGWLADI